MNVLQLVLKQMRQRALGTWLTLLSVTLGVALAIAVLLVWKGGPTLFGQNDYGYDLIIGKGSPMQLVLNSVYHIDKSPGNVSYALYQQLSNPRHPLARLAVPIAVGDTYKGRRVVATTPAMFGADMEGKPIEPLLGEDGNLSGKIFQYRDGRRFEIAEGRVFHGKKFEAVIGSEVSAGAGLKLGDKLKVAHDAGANAEGHEHAEQWEVVGVLKPTHTSNDRCVFIPLVSAFAIEEHGEGMKQQSMIRQGGRPSSAAQTPPAATSPAEDHDDDDHDGNEGEEHHHHKSYRLNADGTIEPTIPQDQWLLSAIFVKARAPFQAQSLSYVINSGSEATAVFPGPTMQEFFQQFLTPMMTVLLLVCILVTIVAAIAILVSIYNSVSARNKEIAILRALGATRGRILTLICLEAGLIGLVGGVLGVVGGLFIGAAGSAAMERAIGQGFPWLTLGAEQAWYLLSVIVLTVLAGLVPALKAYNTPVAANLVAS